jgi:glycoprotein-N-acetylgalactosamine 3-beta-galactosyltransferase
MLIGSCEQTMTSNVFLFNQLIANFKTFVHFSFFIMENIRHKLYRYNTKTSIHMGHRYVVTFQNTLDGYMAGGGQIFSKKAVIKFATKLFPNPLLCDAHEQEAEDMLMGRCLWKFAFFIDARDDQNQKQLFPVGIEEHVKNDTNMDYWYQKNLWHNVSKGDLNCCSDTFMGAHYVSPKEMYLLEYFIYHVHPFGLQKNITEELPRKLTLQEIIDASDTKSYSPNFNEHKRIHNLDEDEKF